MLVYRSVVPFRGHVHFFGGYIFLVRPSPPVAVSGQRLGRCNDDHHEKFRLRTWKGKEFQVQRTEVWAKFWWVKPNSLKVGQTPQKLGRVVKENYPRNDHISPIPFAGTCFRRWCSFSSGGICFPVSWRAIHIVTKNGRQKFLDGGFKHFLFSPLFGEDSHFD